MQQLVRKMAFKMKQNNIFQPAHYSPLDIVIYESNVKILLQSASLIPIQLFRQCQLLEKKKKKVQMHKIRLPSYLFSIFRSKPIQIPSKNRHFSR